MKKFLMVVVMVLFLPVVSKGQLLRDTLYKVSFSQDEVATSEGSAAVVPLDMKCEAGVILSLTVDGTATDNFTTYIYDNQIAIGTNWLVDADRNSKTSLVYSYPSSNLDWKDTDPIPFFCDDTTETSSLFVAGYNYDTVTVMTLNGELMYKCYKSVDFGNDPE